jgi:hypothetical protein
LRKRGNTPTPWFPGGTERSVTYGRNKRSSREEEEEDPPPEGGGASDTWETLMNYEFEALIDTGEAAELLRIHPKTLQQMARAGRVPGI